MSTVKGSFQSAFEKAVQIRKTTNEYNKIGIECEVCEKIFFKTHHFTVHRCEEVLKKLTCVVCQKKIPTPSGLKRHLMIHSGEKLFECEICKRRFNRKVHLTKHRMVHAEVRVNSHTNEKSYKCRLCGKVFRSTINLGIHLAGHKADKAYMCRICQRRFSVKCNLRRHMIIHRHRKVFKCETCGKSFLLENRLKKHIEIHVEKSAESVLKEDPLSKQNLMLQCQTCSRIILHKSQLQRHSNNHPDFICLLCKEYYMNCKCSEDHIDDSEVSKTKNTYSRCKRVKTKDSFVQNPAVDEFFDKKIEEEPTKIHKIDGFNELNKICDKKLSDTDQKPINVTNNIDGTDKIDKPVEWMKPKEECVDIDETSCRNAKYGTIFIEESEEL